MNGHIARMIRSTQRRDQETVASVFHDRFWNIDGWKSYMQSHGLLQQQAVWKLLNRAHMGQWSVQSFHALFIACWIHHPVEKGTYMLQLGSLALEQRKKIKLIVAHHCAGRISSHLSGRGYSAAKGWRFLKGYRELLVQVESTGCQLLLKAEGHALNPSGFIPHIQSWSNKDKKGEGLTASPALHEFAGNNDLVESRGAENFSKDYEALVRGLGFKHDKRLVTVRHMMLALFDKTGYMRRVPGGRESVEEASNARLGAMLKDYSDAACSDRTHRSLPNSPEFVTPPMVTDLRRIATRLMTQSELQYERVFHEIRVTPLEVDRSLETFRDLAA